MIQDQRTFRSATPDDRDAMLDETARLARSGEFARAPVMRKLLDFLVGQALVGNGVKLKAYTVAVDGLGRDERFDPLIDSYPRVQAGRLRKILETHYLRDPSPPGAIELAVAPVGYEVMIGAARAHQTSHIAPPPPSEITPPVAIGPASSAPHDWLQHHWRIAAVALILLCIALAPLVWMLVGRPPDRRPVAAAVSWTKAPVMRVRFVHTATDARSGATDAWIADALRRSWVAEVHLASAPRHARPADRARLNLDVVDLEQNDQYATLQFRLTDIDNGALLWTGNVRTPAPRGEKVSPLDLPVAKLTGPTGVIAQYALTAIGRREPTGYGCLLRVQQFLRTMEPQVRNLAQRCVARSLQTNRSDARILSAASLLAYNRNDASRPLGSAAFANARGLAREAQTIDSDDPAVQFALARIAFLSGDCTLGRERADRAIALWPHSAQQWGMAGFFLFECNAPGAVDYAHTAMRLQGTTSSAYQSIIVFDALERVDVAAATRAAAELNRSEQRTGLAHGLANILLLAAQGHDEAAHAQWRIFAARVDADPVDRRAVYEGYRMSPRHRALADRYLVGR